MKRASRLHALMTILLGFGALAVCRAAPMQPTVNTPPAAPRPELEARVALGNKTVSILQGAAHVQAFRLLTGARRDDLAILAEVQGRGIGFVSQGEFNDSGTIDHAGPDQGRAFVAQVDQALFDNELYDPGSLAKCFDPGVGLRLWKDKERVDVALCFECGQLQIETYDAHGKRIHEIPQLAMGWDQPMFVRLIQMVFPRDAEIQAIKPDSLPADIATPEARAAQEDAIREAIFRHLMTERALPGDPLKTIYFLSIGTTNHAPADPDHALLRRFAGDTPQVKPVSAGGPKALSMAPGP